MSSEKTAAETPTEQELRDELLALVHELHGKKQAEEIAKSFESVFEQQQTDRERMSVAEHWRDFYRLRKYRKLMRRRRPTYQERMTACSACGYPVSHRHHLWDVQMHGENAVTIQLCPNCHELQHLMYNALVRDSAYSQRLALHILAADSVRPETVRRVLDWCRATIRYEAALGWVEQFRTTDEWVDQRLRWSEYERAHSDRAPGDDGNGERAGSNVASSAAAEEIKR